MPPDQQPEHPTFWALLRAGLRLPLELYLRPDSFRRRVNAIAPDLPHDFSLWQARRRWRDPAFRRGLRDLLLPALIALLWSLLALPVAYSLQIAGYEIDWLQVARGIIFNVALSVAAGMALGMALGIAMGVAVCVAFGVAVGAVMGVAWGMALGMIFNVVLGVAMGVAGGVAVGVAWGVAWGVAVGVAGGVVVEPVLDVAGGVAFGITAIGTIFHLWSYPLGLLSTAAVALGRPTPARSRWLPPLWDEQAVLPFPGLIRALVNMARAYPREGAEVLARVAAHPYQRRAALRAYARLTVVEAAQARSLPTIANLSHSLTWLPPDDELPAQLRQVLPALRDIGREVRASLERGNSFDTRLNRLVDARRIIEQTRQGKFWSAERDLLPLQGALGQWERLIETEIARIQAEMQASGYISNPFKPSGNPLEPERSGDDQVFRGRDRLFERLTQLVGDSGRATPLLLVGPRRSGKSSILRFLPRRMSSKVIPVDVSMQAHVDSLPALIERLAGDIQQRALRNANHSQSMPGIDKERAAREPLAAFWAWIDQVEKWLGDRVLLLAIDEYEAIEDDISRGSYDDRILGILRTLIQDRRKIAVMLSGVHQLDELRPEWASALINVVSIKVGFLDSADACALLRHPTKEFPEQTLAAVEAEILHLTHCQPFLLQAMAYSLVERLNEQRRAAATPDDLQAVLPRLFDDQVGAYLSDQWRKEVGGELGERILTRLAGGPQSAESLRALAGSTDNFERLLRRMARREIITRGKDGSYSITVPLLRMYIQHETAV